MLIQTSCSHLVHPHTHPATPPHLSLPVPFLFSQFYSVNCIITEKARHHAVTSAAPCPPAMLLTSVQADSWTFGAAVPATCRSAPLLPVRESCFSAGLEATRLVDGCWGGKDWGRLRAVELLVVAWWCKKNKKNQERNSRKWSVECIAACQKKYCRVQS